MEYKTEYFQEHSRGASVHTLTGLEDVLNKYACEGWKLSQMKESSTGFLLVFERENGIES